MNKGILIGLGVAGVGFLAYKHFYGQGAKAGNVITPYANPQLLAQPSLQYPYQPNQSPRNDNQSQPWYGGSRSFNTQTAVQLPPQSPIGANAELVKGFADITSSLSSIWDDLGVASWFGSDEPTIAEETVSDFAGDSFNWDSLNMWA